MRVTATIEPQFLIQLTFSALQKRNKSGDEQKEPLLIPAARLLLAKI